MAVSATASRNFFNPPKPAPLPPGIQPVKVKDIWSKDENFGWTQAIAFAVHAGVIALLIIPFIIGLTTPTKAVNKQIDVTPLDISPYIAKLPAGADKAGGGGGGGDRSPTPATKGKAPSFSDDAIHSANGGDQESESEARQWIRRCSDPRI